MAPTVVLVMVLVVLAAVTWSGGEECGVGIMDAAETVVGVADV
jgi:hypothetical protein